MNNNKSEQIVPNHDLLRKFVYAINKAVSQDVPMELRENRLETNNRNRFAVGDYINENIKRYVVDNYVELVPFSRYAWEGRLVLDRTNKITYSISTHQTLKIVASKPRNQPHYLMSILSVENGNCQAFSKQMSLGDIDPNFNVYRFDEDVLEEDYNSIMEGKLCVTEEYTHYVIAYTAENHAIKNIEILLLNSDFAVIDRLDLLEFVNPEFTSVFEKEREDAATEEHVEKSRLLKLKPGIKPALKVMREEA